MTSHDAPDSPFADDVPTPEPDASRTEIPLEPRPGEVGLHEFCREIAVHLVHLLHGSATSLICRENPWDHRACPQAWFFDLHVADHLVQITGYQTQHPLWRDSRTSYAIALDGRPVELERNRYESLAWQIARQIWITNMDSSITD